jgi:hypothetical protein
LRFDPPGSDNLVEVITTQIGAKGTFRLSWTDLVFGDTVFTGRWRIIDGTGRYEDLHGEGRWVGIPDATSGNVTYTLLGKVDLGRARHD